jgi:hypothetical protein
MSPQWAATYDATEDQLLWQNQSQLQQLQLRGSVRLGGLFVDSAVASALPAGLAGELLSEMLPNLRVMELVECPDLDAKQLMQLAGSDVAQLLVVQRCAGVSDLDCVAAEGVGKSQGRFEIIFEA